MLCRQDVFQSYYSLISNEEREFYDVLDEANFNPIIVLFLTLQRLEDEIMSLFQSYYSLISN